MTASDLLYNKGARSLILFNLMDITRCPKILNSFTSSFRTYIRGKIQIFNARLVAAIPTLLSSHPGLQVFVVDTYSDFNYLLDNYASMGFTAATIGALNDPNLTDTSFSGPGANYVFWDDQHPTAKTHALVAQWVANVLPAPPPPAIAIAAPQDGTQFTGPTNILIDAAVTSNGWSISQVAFFENNSLVGQESTSPYLFDLPLTATGTYSLSAQLTYGSGQTVSSPSIQVTIVAPPPPPGLPAPAPWVSQDVGSVGQPGSAYYASNGTFTVSGSGNDIWYVEDSFQYLYQSITGDGTIVATVTGLQDTDGFAKAGLMFRETLDPGARNVVTYITPSFGAGFQDRPIAGGLSVYTSGPSIAAPYWLKLQRVGDTFNASGSIDGNQWSPLGSVSIPMQTQVYVGLAVTAHNNTTLNSATFNNVRLVRPPPAAPVLAIARSTNNLVQLVISGTVGATYACDTSTNLQNWRSISTNLNTSGAINLSLPRTLVPRSNFYRARVVPGS